MSAHFPAAQADVPNRTAPTAWAVMKTEAHTGYALFDKKYNANFRYGLGASFYSSDYDNGAERDEVIALLVLRSS